MATGHDAQVIPSRFVHAKRCEKPIAAKQIAAPCSGEESPVGDQNLESTAATCFRDGTARVSIEGSRRTVWMRLEPSMEILTWAIVAIGVLVGGLFMMFGFRKTDHKPMAFGRIDRALKQDWMRTGNIDFYASALESSSPQPLRLLVEEIRVTEGAVGQDIAELRWRFATLEEGKELVVCWNGRQIGRHYSTSHCSEATALVRAGSTAAAPSVPTVPRLQNQARGAILTEAGDLVVREPAESRPIGRPLHVGGVEDVTTTR